MLGDGQRVSTEMVEADDWLSVAGRARSPRPPPSLLRGLAHLSLRPPSGWYAFRLSAGPCVIRAAVPDAETEALVTAELHPPWDRHVEPDERRLDATLFAWRAGHQDGRWPAEAAEFTVGERRLRTWTSAGIRLVRLDTGTTVGWEASSRTALAALADADAEHDAREILHRQLMQRALQQRGFALLHASGVAVDGRAVVIAGSSGAGKTTLQLDLVTAGRGQLLGGGRVYLNRERRVLPYAGRFTVGVGLAANREALRPLLPDHVDRRKLAIRSADLASALRTTLAGEARLALLVFPRLVDGRALQLGPPMRRGEARQALRSQCVAPDAKWPPWLHAFPEVDRTASLSVLDSLAERVPAVRVGVPRSADRADGAGLRELLECWLP